MLAVRVSKYTYDLVSRETTYPPERLKRAYQGWYCVSDEGRSWELMTFKEFAHRFEWTNGQVTNRFMEVVAR